MLMRTDPFRDLDRWAQAMLGSTVGSAARPAVMPMDAYQDNNTFVVHLDLPGVDADSIDLTVEQNVLTVHAERKPPVGESAERVVAERSYGVFSRQLFLGETLDTDAIEASYSGGVLRLTIPVAEKAKPRRIQITSDTEKQAINA